MSVATGTMWATAALATLGCILCAWGSNCASDEGNRSVGAALAVLCIVSALCLGTALTVIIATYVPCAPVDAAC